MEKYFNIQTKDIKFFREEMSEYAPTETPTTLYEVYIRVTDEQERDNLPTQYDAMMEELGYEFMDRDRWFDYDWADGVDKSYWDKWFKFVEKVEE